MMKHFFATLAFAGVLGLSAFASAATSSVDLEDLLSADQLEEELALDESFLDDGVTVEDYSSHYRPHYAEYVCYARNARGFRFQARGVNPTRVQQRAVAKCYQSASRVCYALGCHRIVY